MDCNIQVRNFQFSSVTCRLCLSENLSAPYTDLSEDIVKAEDIRHVLTLQYSTPRAQVTYLHVVVPVMAMKFMLTLNMNLVVTEVLQLRIK